MRKYDNTGSVFIIPGEKEEEAVTDDMYIDYDYGKDVLEVMPKKSQYSQKALDLIQSRKIGRVQVLAS